MENIKLVKKCVFLLVLVFIVSSLCLAIKANAMENYYFSRIIGGPGSGLGQFENPQHVAVDKSGNVYVIDVGKTPYIQKFTSDGTLSASWGSFGSGQSQFKAPPTDIAVDASGNVFVVDSGNDRIQKFSSDGTFIKSWGSKGPGPVQFNSPSHIATGPSGNVYVADGGNHRIQKFNSGGGFLATYNIGGPGTSSIAVDSVGNIYETSDLLRKYNSAGKLLYFKGIGATHVAADSVGNIYVTRRDYVDDLNYNHIIKISGSDGVTLIAEFGKWGSGNGQVRSPYATAVDPAGYFVYVSDDGGNNRVQVFTRKAITSIELRQKLKQKFPLHTVEEKQPTPIP